MNMFVHSFTGTFVFGTWTEALSIEINAVLSGKGLLSMILLQFSGGGGLVEGANNPKSVGFFPEFIRVNEQLC